MQRIVAPRAFAVGLASIIAACGPQMVAPNPSDSQNSFPDATQTTDVYNPQSDAGVYNDAQSLDAGVVPYADAMAKPDARSMDAGSYDAGVHADARVNADAMPTPTDSGMGMPPVCAPDLLGEYNRMRGQSLRVNLSSTPCNCNADPPLGSTGNPAMGMYRAEWGDGSSSQSPMGLFSKSYNRSGEFPVTFYCTTTDGQTSTKETRVVIP